MKFPDKLNVNGKEFALVKQRREAPMAVYKFDHSFLRAGKKEDIEQELKQRDMLKDFGFPVPRRFKLATTDDGLHYYIEKSLGSDNFTEIFVKDIEKEGTISDKSWQQFIAVVRDFANAQIKTVKKNVGWSEFSNAINIRNISKDFTAPEQAKIEKLWEETKERLSIFPFVLTHGDFNSHNLYRQGVIDFEGLYYGPAGFDLVTAIFNPEFFPVLGDYEVINPYRFTEKQRAEYFEIFDKIYLDNGIPRLSDYAKYFEFCRAVWLTADKGHIPKIQEFRKNLFKKVFLEDK